MKDFEAIDKQCIDAWRQEAAMVAEPTRQEIMAMKKSGKSVREICLALELPLEHVSIIVIEEYAKERGETPVFTVGRLADVGEENLGPEFRSGYDRGYARGKTDSKGAALQTIADALIVIAYVKALEFANGPSPPLEADALTVWNLAHYLSDRLPMLDGRDNEGEDEEG